MEAILGILLGLSLSGWSLTWFFMRWREKFLKSVIKTFAEKEIEFLERYDDEDNVVPFGRD